MVLFMKENLFIRACRFGSIFLSGIAFSLVGVLSTQADDIQGRDFYEDTQHGWFWYEDPPPEEEKDKKEKKSRVLPSLRSYTTEELWSMYPDDFQELLNVIQKKAVQQPTEANIIEYLTMQDIARRKALAYTSATMYVTQKYADKFSVASVYPTSKPGMTARVQIQNEEISNTIFNARNNHALLFFTSEGCRFCSQQASILAYFQEKYRWEIKPVDIRKNIAAATRFNIQTTPTLLLVKRGEKESMPISVGVASLTEIERKLYRAVRVMNGETSPSDFLRYDFQKGSGLDPKSIINHRINSRNREVGQ